MYCTILEIIETLKREENSVIIEINEIKKPLKFKGYSAEDGT